MRRKWGLENKRKKGSEPGTHSIFSDKLRYFVFLLMGVRRGGRFCFCLSWFIFGDTVYAVGFPSCSQLLPFVWVGGRTRDCLLYLTLQ